MLKISIITVVLNGIETIEKTIMSIAMQDYQNVEYIVIDGCSIDGTIEKIQTYCDAGVIDYFISEPDAGIYDAMNKGIKNATGDLIGFLNAGDWYESGVLGKIADRYDGSSDVIYGKTFHHMPHGEKKLVEFSPIEDIINDMVFGHPSSFVSKEAFLKFGLFDAKYKIVGDYEWFLRCYMHSGRFQYVDIIVSNFQWGGVSSLFTCRTLAEKIKVKLKYINHASISKSIKNDLDIIPTELFSEKIATEPTEAVNMVISMMRGRNEIAIYGYGLIGHMIEEVCYDNGIKIAFISDASVNSNENKKSEKGYPLKGWKEAEKYSGTVIIAIKKVENAKDAGLNENEGTKYITIRELGLFMLKTDEKYSEFIKNVSNLINNFN